MDGQDPSQTSRFEWLRSGIPEVQDLFDLIIDDLGGPEVVRAGEAILVKLAASTDAIVKRLDAQISGLDEPQQEDAPAVRCRQVMARSLARYLNQLGVTARAREVLSRYEPATREGKPR
jgi:hypothetical protein